MKYTYIYILALLLVYGCSASTEEKQQKEREAMLQKMKEDSLSLKIAVMPTLDCMPLFLAEANGMFQREGVDVRLLPFTAQMDQDTAFQRGRVEGLVTDLVRAEHLKLQGTPLDYVSSTNLYWKLITNRTARIARLQQLEDKMVAVTRYSGTDLLVDKLVDSLKLKSEYVFRVQVNDVTVRMDMLRNGIMDALMLAEPMATEALNQKHRQLFDSRDLDLQLGVLAFNPIVRQDTMRQRQLKAFVRAYNTACDSLNQKGISNYKTIISQYCHADKTTCDSLPADLQYRHIAPPRDADVKRVKDWLNRNLNHHTKNNATK
ncbi:MAG: ABC transporter substrate-binding protein [Prevotella sp.]|nr:ABC transporter substrate-binding protein [Prevotella sp.]